jgi:hypothetical protein
VPIIGQRWQWLNASAPVSRTSEFTMAQAPVSVFVSISEATGSVGIKLAGLVEIARANPPRGVPTVDNFGGEYPPVASDPRMTRITWGVLVPTSTRNYCRGLARVDIWDQ